MKRRYAILIGLTMGVLGSIAGFAAVGRTEPAPYGPPVGPRLARSAGQGELLVAVVGGVYSTRAEADAASAQMAFGDVQGYYVVPVAQFRGLTEQLGVPGDFALLSVFRTEDGAVEFAEMAATFGQPATILSERVQSLGGAYAGLGQETNLEGTGPLLGPIPESVPKPSPVPVPIGDPLSEP
jgi:hypothetical protein